MVIDENESREKTIYVAGDSTVTADGSNIDALILAYDDNGQLKRPVTFYDASDHLYDSISVLNVDESGNLFATGSCQKISTNYDFLILKYNNQGTLLWQSQYNNSSSNNFDIATSSILDSRGNLYVTGKSYSLSNAFEFATIKYTNTGKKLWTKIYNSTLTTSNDEARKILIDGIGNILVMGSIQSSVNSNSDLFIIRYNALTGRELSRFTYNAPQNASYDIPTAMAIYDENILLTGYSYYTEKDNQFMSMKLFNLH